MLKFDIPAIFPPEIVSGISLRNVSFFEPFGFSPGSRCSVLSSNDELKKHRMTLSEELKIPAFHLQFQQQAHGCIIRVANSESIEEESDGMITNEAGIALCVSIADCAAVLIYCPVSHSIGAFHSGWRGTHLAIAKHGIEMMQKNYGAAPESMLVYVSACAGSNNYYVDEDVARLFKAVAPRENGKYTLDIRAEIRHQLLEAQILNDNIECSNACTIADEQYHSFRRDRECSGRMAALIAMRK